jgi:hypothetical protein
MVNLLKLVATVAALIAAVGAFVTLLMQLYVPSGTFFTFVAFSIYVREISE